ncbi:MAG: hypothetical protein NC543_06380 [bacterium]|nr:hypothetical protein [bacterium]
MGLKKNMVSYSIWALYLMGIGIVLSFLGMVVGNQNAGTPYIAAGLMILSFGLLFVVYFLAGKVIDRVWIRKLAVGRAALLEGLVVAVSLVVGIVLRVVMIGGAGEEAAYYEVAKVTEEQMQLQLVQGSIYYYLCLLNGLFRLVGNKWMAGIVLQIVLQLVGIMLAYVAVRRLSGRGAALVSLLFLTLAPSAIREGMTYSPKQLYFCIYAFILLILAQYLWLSTRPVKVLTWILAVLCGGMVAFAGYVDIVGFTLLIPLAGLLGLRRERAGMLQWVAQFMLSMLAMAGTFCLLVYLDSAMSGSSFGRVLQAWSVTYGVKGADYDFFFQEGGSETVLLLIFMGLGIFTFMRRRGEEIFTPWIMMVVSIVIMRILGIFTPNMNGSYQMYFAMTGLSGVALSELFFREGGETEGVNIPEAVVEDLDHHAVSTEEKPVEEKEDMDTGKKRKRRKGDVPMWESLPQSSFEEGLKETNSSAAKEEPKAAEPEEQSSGRFIENPLPLPKKHVKKVMDYPFTPDASQMHYDIEVDPMDNFDF